MTEPIDLDDVHRNRKYASNPVRLIDELCDEVKHLRYELAAAQGAIEIVRDMYDAVHNNLGVSTSVVSACVRWVEDVYNQQSKDANDRAD